ncbi:hypothetical protein [Thermoplasma volcanium GSS1]|uniref:Uncharacterized protein n=1 Tax=Thermoplasma volcanium (strain ATCC 51530 / DSM 4299 / JCM 9571 / NBRC 15438 / GSS1) TaxID=273116 RepID=Q97BI6_THEVO|nr:winged helix-turn-helix domain-containing protein [Thermoplasma volcanium]BAB59611.1 hypothetical protein [Thermoplasma volcanium GSS1]
MLENYGIAILEREGEYIIKPFFSGIPKISTLSIIYDRNLEYEQARKEILDFLKLSGIKTEFVGIGDVNNFFQVFLILQKICKTKGIPRWINVSCGSGLGVSALTIHAFKQNIPMVIYDKYIDKTVMIEAKRLKKINIYNNKYITLIREISKDPKTIKDLSRSLKIDTSTISRRLKSLLSLDMIMRLGKGTRNYPYLYKLNDFGKILLI